MHKVVIAFVFLGVVTRGLGQEPAVRPTESGRAKTEHPLKAALPTADARETRRQVVLKLRVIEISRTKLRKLGFDSQRACSAQGVLQVLDVLRQDRLAKVLAEPTLVTVSNRPISLHVGGWSRVAAPQGNGQVRVEEKPYGTLVDLFPVVLDDQTIHLDCRIELSELDKANGVTVKGETVPALETLRADTTGDFRSGETVVLGGLRQRRRVSSAAATSDSSAGAASQAAGSPGAKDVVEEVETLFFLTPEIVEAMPSNNAARTRTQL